MNIQDNSKFEQMVRNRPAASILPPVNRRLIAQRLGRTVFASTSLTLLLSVLMYKFWLNAHSAPFLKTRRSFTFEADPYSGKVRCNFKNLPNNPHGY
jgi:hypothetical protein